MKLAPLIITALLSLLIALLLLTKCQSDGKLEQLEKENQELKLKHDSLEQVKQQKLEPIRDTIEIVKTETVYRTIERFTNLAPEDTIYRDTGSVFYVADPQQIRACNLAFMERDSARLALYYTSEQLDNCSTRVDIVTDQRNILATKYKRSRKAKWFDRALGAVVGFFVGRETRP